MSNPKPPPLPSWPLWPGEGFRRLQYLPDELLLLADTQGQSRAGALAVGELVHTDHGIGRVMLADPRRGALVYVVEGVPHAA